MTHDSRESLPETLLAVSSERTPRKHLVFSDVDLDRVGRQVGYFYVPHSPDDDAWGTTRIPIAVLKHGDGPTVLLEAGNHGDEYEGQLVLGEVIRDLDIRRVRGRLIVIPAINLPAANAGKRNSPIDGLNFNRAFPGDPSGSVTQQIAAFVNDVLMAASDAFISLHSGGSSLDILPSSIVHCAGDAPHTERNLAAAAAFGAPVSVLLDNLGDTRTAASAAMAAGLTTVSVEMAGQGTVSREALTICRRGVASVLSHLGALKDVTPATPTPAEMLYKVAGPAAYVIANADGVFEPLFSIGELVEAGQVAGRIHFPSDPGRVPLDLKCMQSGIFYAKRQPGLVRQGNCCAVVASRAEMASRD
ncbi:succinylglutamate desuccinylase/aspartoacylase family protein [Cupriavidus sp. UYPR2.512]|uniref:succinylglutamate desuccinylase/aspartoacylase family protein n=1 Tax=Cupriavidus sp. UYPR2.512 TaxID=1080187 RepID=UPI00037F18B6|nr:succinylglutamate desuccinylase/aspartoacylase family protein [Cupriavidus sp. UYPR2.512]UIF89973.1 succinylglutamate desuccinylase/aspartoacylase family protein [Cupriavidus necator]